MHKLTGELLERIRLNRQRMGDDIYRYPKIFHHGGEWPGDFEGRAILSLCSLHHALQGYPDEQASILSQLQLIFANMDVYVNQDGYFGNQTQDTYVDEQQISGNSWFIRGLASYYELTKDEAFLEKIRKISQQYLHKISKYYHHYPSAPRANGGVSGQLDYEKSGWKVSTDIGCAFIMMDGASKAYELIRSSEIKQLIDQMLRAFLSLDYVHLQFQTHATLSFTRGLIRMFEITNETIYLQNATQIFHRYLTEAMTDDFANINWFNRPESWTEPCCIIDSMIIAKKLYLYTKDYAYLKTLNQIYANSIRTFQRDNGGAGCSTCAIGEHHTLKLSLYEAYFCCSMRLGEGFAELFDTVFVENTALLMLLPLDLTYVDEDNEIDIQADIYKHVMHVNASRQKQLKKLLIYLPPRQEENENQTVSFSDELFTMPLSNIQPYSKAFKPKIFDQYGHYYYGDMLLTIANHIHASSPSFLLDGQTFSPITDQRLYSQEELKKLVQITKNHA